MSGAVIVRSVFGVNVPDTNEPPRKVIVALPDGKETTFFIPCGNDPAEGEAISRGPYYGWWPREKVRKLSWAMAP